MSSAMDFAKVFIKRGLDTHRNTYDGNMKLQKLLFFADFISIAEKGKPLFFEQVRAYLNGCVVEEVRLRYKNDCINFCSESESYEPTFTQDEYDVLNLTADIFGKLSARELSDLNHNFSFWKSSYDNSQQSDGFKNKDLAIITVENMREEADSLRVIIDRFKANKGNRAFKEIVNGITFYYSPDIEMTDAILEQLDAFSGDADDTIYSVYIDNGNLVIY
jgi:uncharacterized phage-associated protein